MAEYGWSPHSGQETERDGMTKNRILFKLSEQPTTAVTHISEFICQSIQGPQHPIISQLLDLPAGDRVFTMTFVWGIRHRKKTSFPLWVPKGGHNVKHIQTASTCPRFPNSSRAIRKLRCKAVSETQAKFLALSFYKILNLIFIFLIYNGIVLTVSL